jgi:putative hydrolase of the HAD superfamily
MIDPDIRAVFFDAVGTLLFPHVPVCRTYAECAGRHGAAVTEEELRVPFREAFARQEKRDAHDEWRTDEDRERMRWRAIVEDVLPGVHADSCFSELWSWFSTTGAWTLNPDAAGVIRDLASRGITIGMASNFDARLAGLVQSFPELSPMRDRCVISSLVGWRKPARQFFHAMIGAAGCEPRQILYVGDDLRNDIHGATAAGLRALLFDPDGRSDGGPRIRTLRDLLAGSGVTTG